MPVTCQPTVRLCNSCKINVDVGKHTPVIRWPYSETVRQRRIDVGVGHQGVGAGWGVNDSTGREMRSSALQR